MRTIILILLCGAGGQAVAQLSASVPVDEVVKFKATRLNSGQALRAANYAAIRAGKDPRKYAQPAGGFDNREAALKWRYTYKSFAPWPKDCFVLLLDDATGAAEVLPCR